MDHMSKKEQLYLRKLQKYHMRVYGKPLPNNYLQMGGVARLDLVNAYNNAKQSCDDKTKELNRENTLFTHVAVRDLTQAYNNYNMLSHTTVTIDDNKTDQDIQNMLDQVVQEIEESNKKISGTGGGNKGLQQKSDKAYSNMSAVQKLAAGGTYAGTTQEYKDAHRALVAEQTNNKNLNAQKSAIEAIKDHRNKKAAQKTKVDEVQQEKEQACGTDLPNSEEELENDDFGFIQKKVELAEKRLGDARVLSQEFHDFADEGHNAFIDAIDDRTKLGEAMIEKENENDAGKKQQIEQKIKLLLQKVKDFGEKFADRASKALEKFKNIETKREYLSAALVLANKRAQRSYTDIPDKKAELEAKYNPELEKIKKDLEAVEKLVEDCVKKDHKYAKEMDEKNNEIENYLESQLTGSWNRFKYLVKEAFKDPLSLVTAAASAAHNMSQQVGPAAQTAPTVATPIPASASAPAPARATTPAPVPTPAPEPEEEGIKYKNPQFYVGKSVPTVFREINNGQTSVFFKDEIVWIFEPNTGKITDHATVIGHELSSNEQMKQMGYINLLEEMGLSASYPERDYKIRLSNGQVALANEEQMLHGYEVAGAYESKNQ